MNNKELKIKIVKVFQSKKFRIAIYILGFWFILVLVFQAGQIAGFRKATFGRNWGDNYTKNFGSPHKSLKMNGGEFGDFGNLPNSNGAMGKIIKVELPTIVVFDGKDQTEKIIVIDDKTEIRKMRDVISINELKVDEFIIVIGVPNSVGQIEAKLIRFIPAPLDAPIKNIN
jgi:hypothetical protein